RELDPRILKLYDEYTHRPLDRRVFLERLATLAGGVASANAMLALLENDYARAQSVDPLEAGLLAERIAYPSDSGPVTAYLVRPSGQPAKQGTAPPPQRRAPAVIVIHENRGLNAHIEDVARRVAVAGFVALAPDLLSSQGGTPADEDQAREKIAQLDPAAAVAELRSAVAFPQQDPGTTGKVGAVGFCWGGGMVNRLAVAEPKLDAGVVFYGVSPDPADVPRIHAPLLMHYAERDERINATVPAYEAALRAAGKKFTIYRYPGVQHAFHNDTNAARYDEKAAKLAWKRTIDFLHEQIG
ncbi:MAG: dienelactone hydrolase family protein, partial [Candidatus Eisenbacteria bacterium]